MADAFPSAVNAAADETGLPDAAFPATSPYDFDQAMAEPMAWLQSRA